MHPQTVKYPVNHYSTNHVFIQHGTQAAHLIHTYVLALQASLI